MLIVFKLAIGSFLDELLLLELAIHVYAFNTKVYTIYYSTLFHVDLAHIA